MVTAPKYQALLDNNTPRDSDGSDTNGDPEIPPTLDPEPEPEETPPGNGETNGPDRSPLLTDCRNYIFGHSLLNHALGDGESTDETSVPYWLYLMAQSAGYDYSVSGQYGLLRDHAKLPPADQWQFNLNVDVPNSWNNSFSGSNFSTVMLTAANFLQYQPATESWYDDPNTTPLDSTLTIVDWVRQQSPDANVIIYENWPDMESIGVTDEAFPPTEKLFIRFINT
jgi:hypothetical protein